MSKSAYNYALEFVKKYPKTIVHRLKKNSSIIDKHINDDEVIEYAFAAQKNDNPLDIITTCVVALTNKRIIIGQKRVVFGYFFSSITPDLFNDLKAQGGLIWGKIIIDTVNEKVTLSNIDRNALPEVETKITEFIEEKREKFRTENK